MDECLLSAFDEALLGCSPSHVNRRDDSRDHRASPDPAGFLLERDAPTRLRATVRVERGTETPAETEVSAGGRPSRVGPARLERATSCSGSAQLVSPSPFQSLPLPLHLGARPVLQLVQAGSEAYETSSHRAVQADRR